MPAPPSFHLRPMTAADADAVRRIWNARFGGARSTQENWIDAAVDSTHSVGGFVAVPEEKAAVVGFSFLEVGGRDYTRRYLGLDTLELEISLADRNGLFHLTCVRADWERRGIGSAFYERRLDELESRRVPRAYGIAWHRPHTVDSRVLFETYDFTCRATVERYYSRTGERPHCPDCEASCTCSASLFARTITPA